MLAESVYRSEDVPTADRFDCWRTLVGQTHVPVELVSDHQEDFAVFQRTLSLGAVSVWPASFQPVVFRRTPQLIRESDPEGLHLTLPLKGMLHVSRERDDASYGPYSLNVLRTSHPFEIRAVEGADGLHTGVGLEVPAALLPIPSRRLDRLTGLRLPAGEGFGALLAQLLTQLANGTHAYQLSDGPRLETVVVDLLSALLAHALDADTLLPPATHQQALVLRIRAFVQGHLHDPQLTPPAVAAAHHISTSYLHRLFQREEETVAAWIRRQRLQRARRDLADPAQRATPVHAIAARWGFPRAADFTRAFRTAYGIPPKEYRRQALRTTE
ncbi:helix-turn-helix transcriptional regulator [Streptomyces cinerochromogenes]|uniref:helix-turn-helix transcriptional regulator n=1 Tax=Streptomyces cinerochromogenes TaxID=66422 RepID=UPI0016703F6D|nr:AraC family transcriptional regulator [Streptomyces cinerochromogenes]GGS56307.1 AraC family transcriptional regulator [Streptomyces cinerochromogenes]